ncbi:MAG: hypothetical protein PHI12_14010 [Dehalococcoidales bacterium]|nr:hypothetical protein [Dehalococcoidales bacterium]
MKIKAIWTSLIALLVLSVLLLPSCQKAPINQEIPPDPFTTTWNLGDEGRTFSISGNSAGHTAGKETEFQLRLDNRSGDDPWQGEYCILLVDQDGIVKEVAHEHFDVPVGLETQKPVTVEFPGNFEGPLGLCVVIPQRASIITTLWVGTGRMGNAGPWPNIKTCPYYLTEEGSRELAEKFVRNSPTFKFDGNQVTLELVETLYPDIENAWQFIFHFESAHAGYGDRTGQVLAQVMTPHEAVITIEQGEIKNAVMDEKWDMIQQKQIDSSLPPPAPVPAAPNDSIVTARVIDIINTSGDFPWEMLVEIESSEDVPGYINATAHLIGEQITLKTMEDLSDIERDQVITANVKLEGDERIRFYSAANIE